MTKGHHPNQLAGIRPHQFKPGVSGNPKGTVKRGDKWTAPQWLADWKGREITCADLEAIVKNRKTEHPYKVAAAVQALNGAKTGERWVLGKDGQLKIGALDPEPGRERERLSDRLVGKVRQEIQVTRINEGPSLPDVIREAMAIARQLGPVKVNAMIAGMKQQAEAASVCRMIDTTAEPLPVAASPAAVGPVPEPEPEPPKGGWVRSYDPETGRRISPADPA